MLDVYDIGASISSNATSFAKALVEEVINENPDLFYAGAQYGAGSRGGVISKILVQYYYSPGTISSMKSRYETAMQGVLKWVPANKSDAEKAKAVHDWLVRNLSYNMTAANTGGPQGYGSWNPWNAYGAVVDRRAVCEGYSLAFMAAMKRLGIQATFVTNANHGWNRVRLYDTLANGTGAGYYWFNLDVTWDDPLPDKGFSNTPNTTYFLKSDSYFRSNNTGSYGEHKKWTPAGTAGTNTKYDGGWKGGVYSGNAARATVTALSISPNSVVVKPDGSQQLNLVVTPSTNVVTGEAKWTSSNPAIAAVSSTGLVTAGSTQGSATITVSLGGKTAYCTVMVKDAIMLTGASVSLSTSTYAYKSGVANRPVPIVRVNGVTLAYGTDFTVTYPSDTQNPGVKTATITGKGKYAGTKTFTYTVTGNLAQASLTPANGYQYAYTGAAVKKTPTLKFNTTVLKESTDYTLTWPSDLTSAGTKTITVRGKGVYTGTKTYTYIVKATNISTAKVTYNETVRVTGRAVTQSPVVTLNGNTIPSSNYSIAYRNNVNVGTAQMTITGKGNFTGSVVKSFQIIPGAVWERLAGAGVYDTMAAISGKLGTTSPGVVASTNSEYRDMLAATGLAGSLSAPMLLTRKAELMPQTASELRRMGAKTVYVMGGATDVTDAVVNQIKALSTKPTVIRVVGTSASASAKAVAAAKAQKSRSDTVIIATQAS
ncbi:MAG: Ig-like domain-containing protein, partial [Eggerthellaceae bacterium]|nr:Ig-like domain-containing protein [Eggerthellaceae bacterium]